METTLRKIGNSRGVILPAVLLAQVGIEDQVDIQVEQGKLILMPAYKRPRVGWFDGYQAEQDDDAWQGYIATAEEDNEWTW
jgi:antitoxin MazE